MKVATSVLLAVSFAKAASGQEPQAKSYYFVDLESASLAIRSPAFVEPRDFFWSNFAVKCEVSRAKPAGIGEGFILYHMGRRKAVASPEKS